MKVIHRRYGLGLFTYNAAANELIRLDSDSALRGMKLENNTGRMVRQALENLL